MEYIRLSEIDLRSNIKNRVFITFLARDVSVRLQKDQVTKFISLNMVDKDFIVEAKIFGASDKVIELVQEGKVYNAAVDIKPYDKSPHGYSCIIYNMDFSTESPESFVDWADNLDECQKVITNILPDIIHTYYGQIAYPILYDNWERFARWTAATNQHHTRLGELLVHTSEVISICNDLADYFNSIYGDDFINKPLVISAALLHDICKVKELSVNTSSGKVEYSIHSSLSTHIMDVLSEVDIQAYKLNLGRQVTEINEVSEEEGTKSPEQIAEEIEAIDLLKHCLAAHHGKLEYGSPILPCTPEAVLVNIADNLSADMYRYNKTFKDMDPGTVNSVWTNAGYKNTYKESSK